jgi:hypothetical protein
LRFFPRFTLDEWPFYRCSAAQSTEISQNFPYCERAQKENRKYGLGSKYPFAAE